MKIIAILFIIWLVKYADAQIINDNIFHQAKHYSIIDTSYGTVALYNKILNDLTVAANLTKIIIHKNTLIFKRLDNNNYYGKIGKINGKITVIKKEAGYLNLYADGSYWQIVTGQAKVTLTYNVLNDSLLITKIDVYLLTNSLGKILLSLDVFGVFKKEIDKIMSYIKIVGKEIMINKKFTYLKIKAGH